MLSYFHFYKFSISIYLYILLRNVVKAYIKSSFFMTKGLYLGLVLGVFRDYVVSVIPCCQVDITFNINAYIFNLHRCDI